jgi:hypothetical protein
MTMATVRASIAEAIGVSGGKIEELTARLTDATAAMSAEVFGEKLPGERELVVEATMRNLAQMIANNAWLDTPGKVEAYCNRVGMDLANYALEMRKGAQTLNWDYAGSARPIGGLRRAPSVSRLGLSAREAVPELPSGSTVRPSRRRP